MNSKKMTQNTAILILLISCLTSGIVIAEEGSPPVNEQKSDGPLVLPEDDTDAGTEKKCLTVCKEWGENCVMNPRTGNRQCRKTCKQLGKECI